MPDRGDVSILSGGPAHSSIQSQKPRNPRYRSRALSENHEIPRDESVPPSPASGLCVVPFVVPGRVSMRADDYFASALARPPRQWALKIFIFWARGSCGRTADLKERGGGPLNLVRGDNGPGGKRRVLTPELRGLDRVSCSRFLSAGGPACSGFPGRRKI